MKDRYVILLLLAAVVVPVVRHNLKQPKIPPMVEASKKSVFTNSLGMLFTRIEVDGVPVLFCQHETRSRDYAAFMAAPDRGYEMQGKRADLWRTSMFFDVPAGRGAAENAEDSNHPAVEINWHDAVAFCEWLSRKEGKTYRLPSDREWSVAVGIPQEKQGRPLVLLAGISDVYPWGGAFRPREIFGNYSDDAMAKYGDHWPPIPGYSDGFVTTAPVMSFPPNELGLCDMGGNVSEWCSGCFDGSDPAGQDKARDERRVLRGGAWFEGLPAQLLSSHRDHARATTRTLHYGFRCVAEMGSTN